MGDFIYGLIDTIYIVAIAMLLSLLFGIVLAAGRMAQGKIANSISKAYTIVFRNTPNFGTNIYLLFFDCPHI